MAHTGISELHFVGGAQSQSLLFISVVSSSLSAKRMKVSALFLLGLFSTVLAIKQKDVNEDKRIKNKDKPKRLRRATEQTAQVSEEELVERRTKFGGGNLIAKWVKEAKEDLEEIQELLNKALDDDNSMPPLPVPVPDPTPAPTLPCGMPPVERRGQITATLSQVSKVEDLNKAGSPQNMAFDWLVNKDAMYLCPEDDSLVQRYVAAVFYYSSIGDGWLQCSAPKDLEDPQSIEKANANCNIEVDSPDVGGTDAWLTPVSECQWGGLACRRSLGDSLVRIDFGEYIFACLRTHSKCGHVLRWQTPTRERSLSPAITSNLMPFILISIL